MKKRSTYSSSCPCSDTATYETRCDTDTCSEPCPCSTPKPTPRIHLIPVPEEPPPPVVLQPLNRAQAPAQLQPQAPAQLQPQAPPQLQPQAPPQLQLQAPPQLQLQAPAQLQLQAPPQLQLQAPPLSPTEFQARSPPRTQSLQSPSLANIPQSTVTTIGMHPGYGEPSQEFRSPSLPPAQNTLAQGPPFAPGTSSVQQSQNYVLPIPPDDPRNQVNSYGTVQARGDSPANNQVYNPAYKVTRPGYQATIPANQVVRPGYQVTIPAKQVSNPVNRFTSPDNQVTIPANQGTNPSNEVTIPANQVAIPANQVTVPANQVTIPVSQVTEPVNQLTNTANHSTSLPVNKSSPQTTSQSTNKNVPMPPVSKPTTSGLLTPIPDTEEEDTPSSENVPEPPSTVSLSPGGGAKQHDAKRYKGLRQRHNGAAENPKEEFSSYADARQIGIGHHGNKRHGSFSMRKKKPRKKQLRGEKSSTKVSILLKGNRAGKEARNNNTKSARKHVAPGKKGISERQRDKPEHMGWKAVFDKSIEDTKPLNIRHVIKRT